MLSILLYIYPKTVKESICCIIYLSTIYAFLLINREQANHVDKNAVFAYFYFNSPKKLQK